LAKYLEGYDATLANYLIDGFTNGFRLQYQGDRSGKLSDNPNIITVKHSEVIDKKIAAELEANIIMGPFDSPPLPNFRSSPISVVPKKEPNSFRMIHNLSYPHGKSINDGIPRDLTRVHYASIYDAISFIKKQKQQVFLSKCDIKSAFRIIPIAPPPEDYPLLGFSWRGKYYMDKFYPWGHLLVVLFSKPSVLPSNGFA
jgi:hypothetical protein